MMRRKENPGGGGRVTIITHTAGLTPASALVASGAAVVLADHDAHRAGQALTSLATQGPGRLACFIVTASDGRADGLVDPEQRAVVEAFADEALGATEVVWT